MGSAPSVPQPGRQAHFAGWEQKLISMASVPKSALLTAVMAQTLPSPSSHGPGLTTASLVKPPKMNNNDIKAEAVGESAN